MENPDRLADGNSTLKKFIGLSVLGLMFGACAMGIATNNSNVLTVSKNLKIWQALVNENIAETASRSIYVDNATGSDSNGGTSWADAFLTLQHAVDNIKPIISNGVTITIWAKGAFEMPSGDYGVKVNRVCACSGNIVLRADDYVSGAAVTASSDDEISFAGTYADDYWNGCYVVVYYNADPHVGEGQIKLVTDSYSISGATHLFIDGMWGVNPDTSNKITVAGRASLTTGYGGLLVQGSLTNVTFAGFSIHDLATVEWSDGTAVLSTEGAKLVVNSCAALNNGIIPEITEDFWGDFGCNAAFLFVNYSGCYGNIGLNLGNYSIAGVSSSVFLDSYRGIIVSSSNLAYLNYSYFGDGGTGTPDRRISVSQGGFLGGFVIHGTNGSLYGIYAETSGKVVIAFCDLSVAADSNSFGSAQNYLGGGVTYYAPLDFNLTAFEVKTGTADARMGIATLVAGKATVNTTAVTANSVIFLTRQTASGSPLGQLHITARTAGVSFKITASGGGETSTVAWLIIEPT